MTTIWIVRGRNMDLFSQNPFSQQAGGFPPGRIILEHEIYRAPISGRQVDIRKVAVTVEKNGNYVTEARTEVDPALDDGTVPSSAAEIVECKSCLSLVTRSMECEDCGFEFCLPCSKEVEKDGVTIRLCKDCAAKVANPVWHSIKKALWG